MGVVALAYYISTTVVALVVGLTLVLAIRPGRGNMMQSTTQEAGPAPHLSSRDAFLDLLRYSPIGILFLTMSTILAVEDLLTTGRQLGMYMITNLVGYAVHSAIVLPLIYFVLTRRSPYRITRGILQALVTAVGTNSSAATLPVTVRCCEDNLTIDRTICRFVLPIGVTINMDGTAIFQVVTVVFIAQLNAIPLNVIDIFIICLCTTLTSVGSAGIPGSGFVTLFVIMSAVGLPPDDVYFVLPVVWLLGRVITMVNISGDCVAAALLAHYFPRQGAGAVHREQEENMIEHADIVLCTTLTSVGSAGIPGSGFVTLFVIMSAVGLPPDDVYFVLPVVWLLGRVITMVNISGDCVAAALLAHYFPRQGAGAVHREQEENMIEHADIV
ncbi:excitatory amino acid transporter 4-like [Haliotis cracherodii]|uniref:excitatory amino acid transporter 4-like n=1 Tax=Haliotis cracherodii TaxID=6455 RepID=UPI0039E887B2